MFRYKVNYFDKDAKNGHATESGLVAANSYGEAADRIIAIYGKDDVCTLGLYELDSWLTDDQLREELENDNFDL